MVWVSPVHRVAGVHRLPVILSVLLPVVAALGVRALLRATVDPLARDLVAVVIVILVVVLLIIILLL